MPAQERDRYTAIAILLHWAIAAAIGANALLGWWMHGAIDDAGTRAQAFAAYQLHKSIGLSVLALSLVRLGWRLANPPPPLPDAMQSWEKLAAKATHWAFYALMIAIPLTGWTYVSTQWREDGPFPLQSTWFGVFRIPLLFGLESAPAETREDVSELAIDAHAFLVWSMMALLALHVAAALKHHFIDRDPVLAHMVPGLKPAPRTPRRALTLAFGFAAMALAAAFGATAFVSGGAPAPLAAVVSEQSPVIAQTPPIPAAEAPKEAPSAPAAWIVDPARSSVTFAASASGAAINGRFETWRASIRLDPADPETASATITFETGAAIADMADMQASVVSADGFDSANHPTATFRLTRLQHRSGDTYRVRGTLTLKGRAIRIDAPATLVFSGNRATLNAQITIRRDEADIGMQSDPDFEIVDREIRVGVAITARRS